ncbi:hypothetical protein J3459_018327 [Metarhizium acridum]|nr:hypothetical protein J3459_018327 [Metarhizium acridum]
MALSQTATSSVAEPSAPRVKAADAGCEAVDDCSHGGSRQDQGVETVERVYRSVDSVSFHPDSGHAY